MTENVANMPTFVRTQPKQTFELQLIYRSYDFSLRPSSGQSAQGIQKATPSPVFQISFILCFSLNTIYQTEQHFSGSAQPGSAGWALFSCLQFLPCFSNRSSLYK